MIDDLLSLADDLTRRETGRPKQTSLRKAISSAYYAVFHALAETFANELVGFSRAREFYTPVYRFPDHAVMAKKLTNLPDIQIKTIATTFRRLQEYRLMADYDPGPFRMGRSQAIELINQARDAVAEIRKLKSHQRLTIATTLLTKAR